DVHYIEQKHAIIQEVLWAIAEGKKMTDPDRRRHESDQFYLKTTEEMFELWKDDIEPVENTNEVAERCDVDLKADGVVLLRIETPNDYKGDHKKYLKDKTSSDGQRRLDRQFSEQEKTRIGYELEIITNKDLAPYFLMCADFAEWAGKN